MVLRRLDELDEKDQAKLAHEQAKNSLEAFLLDMKDKLSSKEYEVAITPEDKDSLMAKLGATSDWLEYDSDEATTEVSQYLVCREYIFLYSFSIIISEREGFFSYDHKELKEKRKELKTMARPMLERVREHRERPEALSTLNTMLNMSNTFLNGARGLEDPVFTEVELSTLEKLIKDTEEWRAKNVKEQKSQPLHKTPVFTLRDVAEKVGNLDREVKYLLNKARTAPKKPKKESE
ncbi:hyou1 [Cordylochernes scorpioides]|uniref:Hypoxia up-regulated protein 1 n=1 Tax=Cordylochernes scorpioides TaxID=51811 RepID=A0ABY6KT70_9ARAC|nr:hyou1 [Cordylochernes scorpioides]